MDFAQEFVVFCFHLFELMLRRTYRLRLKTSSETSSKSDSNCVLLYFKGETGLTQTIRLLLNQLREEEKIELLDVGNVNQSNEDGFLLLLFND